MRHRDPAKPRSAGRYSPRPTNLRRAAARWPEAGAVGVRHGGMNRASRLSQHPHNHGTVVENVTARAEDSLAGDARVRAVLCWAGGMRRLATGAVGVLLGLYFAQAGSRGGA